MRDEGFGEGLLRETREELAKADAKASILLAASGIALAALLSEGKSAAWYPAKLSCDAAATLVWIALSLGLGGICCVAAAVKPRLRARRPRRGDPHYFADVEAFWPRWWQRRDRGRLMRERRSEFHRSLQSVDTDKKRAERVEDQIWALSHIAYLKYRLVTVGIWAFAAAVGAAVLALVVQQRWG